MKTEQNRLEIRIWRPIRPCLSYRANQRLDGWHRGVLEFGVTPNHVTDCDLYDDIQSSEKRKKSRINSNQFRENEVVKWQKRQGFVGEGYNQHDVVSW